MLSEKLDKYVGFLKTPMGRIIYRHGCLLEFYEYPGSNDKYITTRVYLVKRRGRGVKLIELRGYVI
jgi:hypothetical protein